MGEFNISFSDDEALDYIRKLENPHKVGWDGKVWRTPKGKGFDNNLIAYGLDIRLENNPIVYNFLKTKGRLNDPWLTDAEAKKLTALTFALKKDSIAKAIAIAGGNVSQMGYNRLAGMAWHGDPMKRLLDKDSITGKAFREEVANGNKEFTGTFDTYYNYGTNKKRYADRAAQDYTFRPQYVLNDAGKRLVINPAVYTKEQFLPDFKLQQPTKTVYPLNSEVPQSISSWSGVDAPNATPRMPSLQENLGRSLKDMWDIFDRNAVAYGRDRTALNLDLPSLEDLMLLNSPEEQLKRWVALTLEVPLIQLDMPMLLPLGRFKCGKLPKYEDGTVLEIVVTPKKRSKGSLSPRSAVVTPDITTEFDDGITRDQILDTIYISNANGLNTYNKEQFFNKYGISADENSEKYYKWLGGKPFLRSKTRREILSDKYKLHIGNRYGQYAQDVADAINYINGYYKSPQYLDRIAGNEMDPVNYVAEARNFLALYEPSGGPAWQHSNDHENTFYIPMTSALFNTAYPDKEYDPYLVAAHEYAHYMLAKTRGVGDNAFNGRDKNLFDRRINVKYPNHDTNYNENYADLMATRADMYRRGYVDKNNPYGEITLDAIKDYRSKYGLNNRFFDLYNDEDIRSMYNTIAQNQYTQDNSILYARDGKLPEYSNGKPIRIKPANRGKLTRLKKRTGKSESELYNDGNPAHRKMVVFARNARKWSHKR